jgi:4-diphosphocytidyl-2-C-methyl-D-erythritol kinase
VPEPVTVRVPAKVNLSLQIKSKRPDGFHELNTVFQAVSLYDDVTATPAEGLSIAVTGEGSAELPLDRSNLALRAAALLAERAGVNAGVHLTLGKRIPVAGGLAGGSADAAGALVACDALWDTGLDREALLELAAEIGSDVPFALHGGTALGTGRGEYLAEVLARGSYHWVIAFAHGGLATSKVYRKFDELGGRTGPGPEEVIAALRSGDAVALGAALSNDLQPAALALWPALARVLDAGRDDGALASTVSGSGPSVALLARDSDHATALAARLAGQGVCRTVRRAYGPVGGARLVDGPEPAGSTPVGIR